MDTSNQADCPLNINEIYLVVEQNPTLIGGPDQISEAIRYPLVAKIAGIEGRVLTQFVVDQDGEVNCVEVVKGLGYGLDTEAIRVVSELKFTPGLQKGEPANVRFSLPVVFDLPKAN